MRRACAGCHVPIDGLGAIPTMQVSHGSCDTCGGEDYGPLWDFRVGVARWSGKRLARARRGAGHSTRRLASWLGVAHSTVQRAEGRPRLTRYVQRALCDKPAVYAYYRGLTLAAQP